MAKFHIRARTIDLLGRQQIANISTAISELFKNAHDAYATTAEVDYFRDDGLFVLRDDGLGMSQKDFEDRWLTLGTDSKVGSAAGLACPAVDKKQDRRPLLGEKGIGRLSVAVIGKQVLVLTRARIEGIAQDKITAAYIHWGLFRLPGIDLDELTVPLETFDANRLPNLEDVKNIVARAKENLINLSEQIPENEAKSIQNDMEAFQVDPREISTYLTGPSFEGDGTGTHFYILPADDIIKADIDDRDDENKATRLEKNLIGFTNTMTPGFNPPNILTRFRDHVDEGTPIELIGEKAFFSPEEFHQVDHHIRGRFDEYGQFRGEVGIYQTSPMDYVLNWKNTDGRHTACGPFDFSIAVIQPNPKDSLVEPTEHAIIRRKIERHGGIYIYKDGVRIQPYGGTENDFLDVERRRTQRAGTYYYSFRNMMGAIELDSKNNPNLVEKAGREGFREDRAYRQFRSILINFLVQSAADFFVEKGKYSEEWVEKRVGLQRFDDLHKKREKQHKTKKNKFRTQLETFFDEDDSRKLSSSVLNTLKDFEKKVQTELDSKKSPETKALAIGRIEIEAKAELDKLRKYSTIAKPRGVGLNKELLNNWQAYEIKFKLLSERVFTPAEKQIESIVTKTIKVNKLNLKPGKRLKAAVQKHSKESVSSIKALKTQTENALSDLTKLVQNTTKTSFRNVSTTVDKVLVDLEALHENHLAEINFSEERENFEQIVNTVFEKESEKLRRLASQLETVLAATQPDGADIVDVTESLEQEVVALRERQDIDFELAQIGMALNTINHEFGKTAGGLRDGFRRLKSWANANPDLNRLYNDMRASFDHLDNYLLLFNPLDRRLQRKAVNIKGKEIFRFVSDLFEKRLIRHNIQLIADETFKSHILYGFQADFYPVFVNLIDNAIYWTSNGQNDKGVIELIGDGNDLCIRDNGRGVSSIDVLNIFEMNFTRKPGGRGMGLHISKQVLDRLGYDLSLDPPVPGAGAGFRISKRSIKGLS